MSSEVPIIAAMIAVLSAITASYISLRGQRLQYFGELRRWAEDVCDILAEADHACDLDPTKMAPNAFFELRHQLSHRMSAQIDRGRWFLPNLVYRDHGNGKAHAYRGLRQPALDYLVGAYKLIRELDYGKRPPNQRIRRELVVSRRVFISEVQKYLDPRVRRAQFTKLVSYKGPIR